MQTKKMGDSHKEKMEEGGQNVYLPPEIIHEIVSRLPVKPLSRFKCVSKSWESLISDPDFVANYSKAAFENEDVLFRRRRLLFTLNGLVQGGIYSLDVDQFLSENPNAGSDHSLVAASTELGYTATRPWVPFVQYSCYGLILARLFSGNSSFSYSLINPVTKESKKLPKPPKWRLRLPREPYYFYLYGVGFDDNTNDYKVINGQQYDDGVVFSVYTLQTNSWRRIDNLVPCRVLNLDGIMLNGGVHWLASKVADESLVIISFVLAEEKVREIALPPNAATNSKPGAFRDWLCLTSVSPLSSATFNNEFWVMKKYGVSESWTQMRVSIPYKELSHSGFWTKSHDLMVVNRSLFVMYNFNDDTYWNLSIGKAGEIRSIGIYVETLPTLTHRLTSWDINFHSFT